MHPADLSIEDYTYELPDEQIARYPLEQRDASKLLVYQAGTIREEVFTDLPNELPSGALVVFNQTRVVNARLQFRKPTGGLIEIFCLEPHEQYGSIPAAMAQHGKVWWHCMVGGAAKWKPGVLLELNTSHFLMTAMLVERTTNDFIIELAWNNPELSFAEVLSEAGKIPLPPYLNREAEASDLNRYQTLFAAEEGSVAAPTASLHFTPEVMQAIAQKDIDTALLTLHVGAGTFKPVKSETIGGHHMHAEWLEVTDAAIQSILDHLPGTVVAAGTTAMRTLESLYWIGCKIMSNAYIDIKDLAISQWEPYERRVQTTATEALAALLQWMQQHNHPKIITKTGILIAPGYTFRVVSGLVTNFHQPQSTLLLLVAALIGDDWKKVYEYALAHQFRFLSYGDSSLLWKAGVGTR